MSNLINHQASLGDPAQHNHKSKFSSQNSHPVSLHEQPFKTEETQEKSKIRNLIQISKEQSILYKHPSNFNLESFRVKFPQIESRNGFPRFIEEKNSASTQTTGTVSRDGKEVIEYDEIENANPNIKLQGKKSVSNVYKISKKAPILKEKPIIMQSSSKLSVEKHEKPIILLQNNSKLLVDKIPENESLIIDDKSKEDIFSDLHLIKETSSQTSSLENKHEIKGQKIAWKQGDLIGYGSYGEVFRAMNCLTGQIFAVKKIHVNKFFGIDKNSFKEIQGELAILKQFSHPNIVTYYDFEEIGDALCIYFEYMSGGNIASLLKKYGPFPEDIISFYSKQILSALSYIHSRRVIHKDIKGANILVGNSGNVKLADFGSAQQLEKSISVSLKSEKSNNSIVGSVPWMAPEVVRQTKYGRKSDVWSFGCTVLEMVTGNSPWANYKFDNPIAAIMKIGLSDEIPEIPKDVSKELRDFIKVCLVRDQKKRASIEELRKHAFLNKE